MKATGRLRTAPVAVGGWSDEGASKRGRARGAVIERVPDFRQFNHVLLAVGLPDGGRLFCDPSSGAEGTAGLPPTVADRRALLVDGSESTLVRIPAVAPGRLGLDFELDLSADGELWGWLDLRAEGFQARRAVAEILAGAARAGDRLAALLEGVFVDVRVVEVQPADAADPPAGLRAFVHALAWPEAGGVALHAPEGRRLIPDPGDEERRQTRYWQSRGGTVVHARYRLPSGWAAQGLPPDALHRDQGAVIASGEWRRTASGQSGAGLVRRRRRSRAGAPAMPRRARSAGLTGRESSDRRPGGRRTGRDEPARGRECRAPAAARAPPRRGGRGG